MSAFGIFVDGAQHGGSYAKAKSALSDAMSIWKANPAVRPEVVVRRLDGHRAVHKLPGGTYTCHRFSTWTEWRRVSK